MYLSSGNIEAKLKFISSSNVVLTHDKATCMFIWFQLCYAPVSHVTSLVILFSLLSLSFFFPIAESAVIRNLLQFFTFPFMKFGGLVAFRFKVNIFGYDLNFYPSNSFITCFHCVCHYIIASHIVSDSEFC